MLFWLPLFASSMYLIIIIIIIRGPGKCSHHHHHHHSEPSDEPYGSQTFFPVPYLPVGTWPYSIAALRRQQQPLGSSSPDLGKKKKKTTSAESRMPKIDRKRTWVMNRRSRACNIHKVHIHTKMRWNFHTLNILPDCVCRTTLRSYAIDWLIESSAAYDATPTSATKSPRKEPATFSLASDQSSKGTCR